MNPNTIQSWFMVSAIIFQILTALCGLGAFYFNKKAEALKHQEVIDKFSSLEAAIYDRNNKKIQDFTGVEVLQYKIVSSQKGYMRIKVSKDYLNTSFNDPITLKYEYGKYQPVMLTFKNDDTWGAGVTFNSPDYQKRAEVYLNQCIRFSGGGKMTYTEDLIFELYFNDYCMYFATISGMVKFEHTIPPIRFGRNLCIGYYNDNDSKKNKNASKDFQHLEKFFEEAIQNKR